MTTCPELKLVGPSHNQGGRHPGNLAFVLASHDAKDVLMKLSNDFCFSLGSACSSGNIETSKSLGRLIEGGFPVRNSRGFFRLGIDRDIRDISFMSFLGEFSRTLDTLPKHIENC